MMFPLSNMLTILTYVLVMIMANSALAFTTCSSLSSSKVMPSTRRITTRYQPSPLFASTVGGFFNTNTRPRIVPDRILQYLERKEANVQKEHSRVASDVQALNAELTKIRTRKEEYLQSQAFVVDATTTTSFSESTLRSAVKAFLWRIIAGSITFVTSLQFSGSVASALSIVGSDFGSKMATMFLGERLMNTSQAGRKSGSDAASRSLAKALIWRLFAIVNSLTVAIFITKDLSVAGKIAGSDAICKTGLMFAYERVWAKVEWGKSYDNQEVNERGVLSVAGQATR